MWRLQSVSSSAQPNLIIVYQRTRTCKALSGTDFLAVKVASYFHSIP
jgi:hypothetical protein